MKFSAALMILVAVGEIFVIVGLLPVCFAQAPEGAPSSEALPTYGDYSPTSMEPGEKQALFEVMNALAEGDDWSLTHPDPCGYNVWHGVECDLGQDLSDKNMHVISLAFGLTSGLDPNPSCKSDAYIPLAILKLTFLENLFIYECFTRTEVTIPSYLGQLTSLEMLDIRSNPKLVGSIPPELGNLTNLEVFSLAVNNLSGSIPDLGSLRSLQNLDFSYNALNGTIPSSLGRLENLVVLNLRSNNLRGVIPSSLGRLSKVQKLDLGGNALEGTVPGSVGNMFSLVLLGLDNNKLEHGLPESFNSLLSLQYLLAHNNRMHHPLPDFWRALRNTLVYASLSNSSYTGPIPDSICELRNLSFLALDNNGLTGQIPEGMEEMSSLTFLNLSRNNLSGPVPFSPKFVNAMGPGLILDRNSALCEPATFPPEGQSLGLPDCPDESWDAGSSDFAPAPHPGLDVPSLEDPSSDVPSSVLPNSTASPSRKSAAGLRSKLDVTQTMICFVFTWFALG